MKQLRHGDLTTYHIHIPLRVLLGYSDKKLGEVVTHPDGVQAARDELRQMQLMGKTVLAAGKCDNQRPDGSCAGHPAGEEGAA
ncbi:hypothetical protein [Halomonas sp. OfavH-34-E]|uniref:hypothetical protein n=1 Tax=Halomonas sp. OfavH-34-E TaxID=2954491 RepID=UPI002096A917|nr:hypothetical protein [Halomonas sp. OfavH-34-E]MCO7218141.1 hypothetical protein [Halomonas sp. OfavH-34-E]